MDIMIPAATPDKNIKVIISDDFKKQHDLPKSCNYFPIISFKHFFMNKQGVVFHVGFPTKTEPRDTMNSGRNFWQEQGGKRDGGKPAGLPEGGKNPPTFASKTSFILQRNFPVFFGKNSHLRLMQLEDSLHEEIRKLKSGGKHLFSRIIRKRKT